MSIKLNLLHGIQDVKIGLRAVLFSDFNTRHFIHVIIFDQLIVLFHIKLQTLLLQKQNADFHTPFEFMIYLTCSLMHSQFHYS